MLKVRHGLGQRQRTRLNSLPSPCFLLFLLLPPSLQLLSLSLDQVDNEEWLMELGNALGDQEQVVTKYSNFPQEKVGQV